MAVPDARRGAAMWVIGTPLFAVIGLYAVACVIAGRDIAPRWGSLTTRERLHVVTVFLAAAVFLGCVANFAAFFTASLALGGDAVAGKAEGGRYFLSSKGRLTEVSQGVWEYSLLHVRSLWVTHPLSVLALAVVFASGRAFGAGMSYQHTITGTPEGVEHNGDRGTH
jgi:hypothetical protein